MEKHRETPGTDREQKKSSVNLSQRLHAIAALVTDGSTLVDVGCDHGWLPVYLMQEKRIVSAIASDVREGPLSRAEAHIRAAGLEEKIRTRLSDGLKSIVPGEGDCLVAAGMGGILIRRILTESPAVRESFREMILQPQSDVMLVRDFLQESGWQIADEKMVCEDGKFYTILKAVHKKEEARELTPEELVFGPVLLRKKDPVLHDYLRKEERKYHEILQQIGERGSGSSANRKETIRRELSVTEKALAFYQQ